MKYSGMTIGVIAILASACSGGKQLESRDLLVASAPGLSSTGPGGGGGPLGNGDGAVGTGGGTSGGNPTLTSMNTAADPSLLSLCMVGKPVLLRGKTAVTVLSSTRMASAEPFDLVTGDAGLALFYYPEGTYSGLRITYAKGCTANYSAQMQNAHGKFQTSDTLTVEFAGSFVLFGKSARVQLNIEPILRGLAVVYYNEDLPTVFRTTQGAVRQ